jgi:hypothetical protein
VPIPEFIVELRRAIGHAPLWLVPEPRVPDGVVIRGAICRRRREHRGRLVRPRSASAHDSEHAAAYHALRQRRCPNRFRYRQPASGRSARLAQSPPDCSSSSSSSPGSAPCPVITSFRPFWNVRHRTSPTGGADSTSGADTAQLGTDSDPSEPAAPNPEHWTSTLEKSRNLFSAEEFSCVAVSSGSTDVPTTQRSLMRLLNSLA